MHCVRVGSSRAAGAVGTGAGGFKSRFHMESDGEESFTCEYEHMFQSMLPHRERRAGIAAVPGGARFNRGYIPN